MVRRGIAKQGVFFFWEVNKIRIIFFPASIRTHSGATRIHGLSIKKTANESNSFDQKREKSSGSRTNKKRRSQRPGNKTPELKGTPRVKTEDAPWPKLERNNGGELFSYPGIQSMSQNFGGYTWTFGQSAAPGKLRGAEGSVTRTY